MSLERPKIAEEFLSGEGMRLLMDTTTDALFWFDPELARLLACNRVAESLLALSAREMVGKGVAELFPQELELLLRQGERGGSESRIRSRTGTETRVKVKSAPGESAWGSYRLVVLSPREEAAQLEADLKSERLESLGVLAGGIAHNFNNILTGILGNLSFAQLLLEESHRAALPLEQAEKAAHRAADLAAQLITFATGGAPVKKPLSARQLVAQSVSLALQAGEVRPVLDLPDDLEHVEADPGQMGQVFRNIVTNAVQAMPGGGMLSVRGENVGLAQGNPFGLPAGRYVAVSFADQGEGIAPEHRDRVFDPYFTTKSGRAGLGLASAHSIVNRHGGSLRLWSELDSGTTVTVYLPALPFGAAELAELPEAGLAGAVSGGTVLVMDDEEIIRDLASDLLDYLGYAVETCADGEEAVARYKAAKEAGEPYYATLMDLTIPGGMGGKDAAREILEFDASARLIVSSGYSNDPVIAQYEDYGFCAAITKPYLAGEIAKVLTTLPTAPKPRKGAGPAASPKR